MGSILVTPIAQVYVGDLTSVGREGRITNLFYASMFAGMALGPLLGGYLVEGWSLEAPFYVMGILSLVALIGVAKWVPDDRKAPRGGTSRAAPNLRAALRNPAVIGMIVYFATRGLWRQSFNSFWPLLAQSHGHNESAVGLVLTSYLLGEGLFSDPIWISCRSVSQTPLDRHRRIAFSTADVFRAPGPRPVGGGGPIHSNGGGKRPWPGVGPGGPYGSGAVPRNGDPGGSAELRICR